ncbi:MAG: helix-hairpin-helix domain-containing protein [Gemmatimonadetes bacterium]|nr:helix-hairpin-helix domain-containing protein [Gemmatimonadota bacterium]
MAATSQERLALGVAALLLAAGAVARVAASDEPVPLAGASGVVSAAASRLVVEVADSVARAGRRRAPLGAGERLDPNTASADELDRLPGVGPALAGRIVAWRAERGRFRTLADLDSVPGVGPALLRRAAPHLSLRPAPAALSRGMPSQPARERGGGRTSDAEGMVDVNTASAEELAALPGIGPSLAGRIVAWRATNGRFRSPEALEEVPGIGPATVSRLRPRIRATP